jgi:hypothetical protein
MKETSQFPANYHYGPALLSLSESPASISNHQIAKKRKRKNKKTLKYSKGQSKMLIRGEGLRIAIVRRIKVKNYS